MINIWQQFNDFAKQVITFSILEMTKYITVFCIEKEQITLGHRCNFDLKKKSLLVISTKAYVLSLLKGENAYKIT